MQVEEQKLLRKTEVFEQQTVARKHPLRVRQQPLVRLEAYRTQRARAEPAAVTPAAFIGAFEYQLAGIVQNQLILKYENTYSG